MPRCPALLRAWLLLLIAWASMAYAGAQSAATQATTVPVLLPSGVAYDASGNLVVAIDPRFFRPAEVETLLGDASRARRELGWEPRTSFDQLVEEMVAADLKVARRDALVVKHGYDAIGQPR